MYHLENEAQQQSFSNVNLFNSPLIPLALEKNKEYLNNQPFPHIYFDNLLNPNILNKIIEEAGKTKKENSRFFYGAENKFTTEGNAVFKNETSRLIHTLLSPEFVLFLETLTGIKGLITDPYLEGGGIHETLPGGFLKIHSDFNWHVRLKLHRRVNVLIYLNENWKEKYGGHLELWSSDMKKCEKKLLPIFNRMAIFSTSDISFHGHPVPLTCPPDRCRRSIALYYYTHNRPKEEINKLRITTVYKSRPGEDILTKRPFHRKVFESLPVQFQEFIFKLLKRN